MHFFLTLNYFVCLLCFITFAKTPCAARIDRGIHVSDNNMKSFLNKVFGYKTKRLKSAPLNCQDFVEKRDAPSIADIQRTVIAQFQSRAAPGETVRAEDMQIRALTFDLKYRCGGAGRCIEKDFECRYPCCFTLRPMSKGAEILHERMGFEIDDPPLAGARAIVDLCRREELDKAVEGLQSLIASTIRKQVVVHGGKYTEDNILSRDEATRDMIIPLLLWRAALLVNIKEDESAVSMLLNTARQFPSEERQVLFNAAAGWAVLNDMEIVYYRSLLSLYESFLMAEVMAHQRPLLIRRVLEQSKSTEHVQMVATVVLGKELAATAAKSQASQQQGDETEDPIRFPSIPMALTYYRFNISEEFWAEFLKLLLMPPGVAAPGEELTAEQIASGVAPPHVTDAAARSFYLHHLMNLAITREDDLRSGKIVLPADLANVPYQERYKYGLYLDTNQLHLAKTRMRELLETARNYEKYLHKRSMELRDQIENDKE